MVLAWLRKRADQEALDDVTALLRDIPRYRWLVRTLEKLFRQKEGS